MHRYLITRHLGVRGTPTLPHKSSYSSMPRLGLCEDRVGSRVVMRPPRERQLVSKLLMFKAGHVSW